MIPVTTKFGKLYMEKASEREETDKIKLYDSDKRYFDYLPLDIISPRVPLEQYCEQVIQELEKLNSVEDLLSYLWIVGYTVSKRSDGISYKDKIFCGRKF